MTRRVTLPAVLLVAAAIGAGAPATAAAFQPLTETNAQRTALQLARSLARDRNVVHWELSPAVKVRRTRIVFLYSDRNRDNVFCTAKIIIEQTERFRSSTVAAGRCAPVPAEALAMEKATNALIRAVRAKIDTVRASNRAFQRSLRPCESLVIPRKREADVEALLSAGQLVATYSPILAQLDGFVTALQDVQPVDSDLVRGVVSWRRFLTLLAALPRPAGDACPAIGQWAANAYAPESAPADFAELRDQLNAIDRQGRGIQRAAERMAKLGVLTNTVTGFDPYGLLLRAAGVRLPQAGSAR
jgi:hypothetical protein